MCIQRYISKIDKKIIESIRDREQILCILNSVNTCVMRFSENDFYRLHIFIGITDVLQYINI